MKQLLYIIGLLLLVGPACTERMDIYTDNATPRLVITGYVTTDTAAHYIEISRTISYFGNEIPKKYPNAMVKINNAALHALGNGIYATAPTFHGISGETYVLDVWVDFDEDGYPEHYTASTTIPAKHILDSITLAPVSLGTTKPPWLLMLNFQDLPGPNHFGAHLYINRLWYSNKLQRYFLNNFGDNAAEGQYIRFPAITYTINEEMRWDNGERIDLHPGDTLTLELNTLSEEYFEFIRTAQAELGGSNPLFAGPPANIPTNISNGALGIFGSYTTSRKQLILPPENWW